MHWPFAKPNRLPEFEEILQHVQEEVRKQLPSRTLQVLELLAKEIVDEFIQEWSAAITIEMEGEASNIAPHY